MSILSFYLNLFPPNRQKKYKFLTSSKNRKQNRAKYKVGIQEVLRITFYFFSNNLHYRVHFFTTQEVTNSPVTHHAN